MNRFKAHRTLIPSGLTTLLAIVLSCEISFGSDELAKDAARVLASRCLECHSGSKPKGGLDLSQRKTALRGGESGAAIVPEILSDSLVWKNVEDDTMPPEEKGPLSKAEKQTLRQWIQAGASYPNGAIDRFQYSTDSRAGYDWWSLQPVVKPDVPDHGNNGWVRNPIDAFILTKLLENQLPHAPEASPRVLVRRLYFNLIGLPPTPEQVDRYVNDPSEKSYRELVDKLLKSPHYGERWARHWLDVARFGESHGFERNQPRENQWYFRDWVINALNADLAYDEFARHQIAGDHLSPGKVGLAAAAFLTAGVHNTVVGGSVFMKKTARQDELEEIAGAVGQTFVGLTVNCARCHDHKFDPITQTEYYRFVSALSGVYHGEKEFRDAAAEQAAAEVKSEIATFDQQIRLIDEPARQAVLELRKQPGTSKPDPPPALYTWDFDSHSNDTTGDLPGRAVGEIRFEGGALVVDGTSYVETEPLKTEIKAKTLEALITLANLDQRGGGVISLQTRDGAVFDAIVFGERQERRWMAGSNSFRRSLQFSGAEEKDAANRPVHIAIVYHADGTIHRYRDGQLYGETYKTGVQEFSAGNAVVRFGIRHTPAGGNRQLQGKIFRARLYDRALSEQEVAAAAGTESQYVSEKEILAGLDLNQRAERDMLVHRRANAHEKLSKIDTSAKGKVFTVAAKENPGITKFLKRGNALDEGDTVTPGAIKAVPGTPADFGIRADASDADRRTRLADWITDPDNPLFKRVVVNRLWHYHFGTGIVETPNDFGYNGGRPSHPKLLDWLASQIAERGWSLKQIHRLIVMSSTYRQSSRPNAKAMAVDADNRLLWRMSPKRLDAESLRDAMLHVSGKLNPKRFGPGFRDVKVNYLEGTTYYLPFDEENEEFHRRTVYRFSPRGGRSAILDTFDCPDPANAAPRRTVTTTPLQALALLNNGFSLRIGGHFANRIVSEAGENLSAQVQLAYRLALGRQPDQQEQSAATEFVRSHGMPAFARVLFNCNEFVVIE